MNSYPKLFIPGPTHVPKSIMKVLSTPQIGHRTEDISEIIKFIFNAKKHIPDEKTVFLSRFWIGCVISLMIILIYEYCHHHLLWNFV